MITEDDERRYGLKPLPEYPPQTVEEAQALQRAYEETRKGVAIRDKEDC